jgi:RHS repeat-associated protein
VELQERSNEALYQIMVARYYSSSLGRFMAVDPSSAGVEMTAPQSWNRYTYASNNPIAYVDPNGESSLKFDGKAQTLTLYNNKGCVVGTWKATNNVTKYGKNANPKGNWEDGTYKMRDRSSPKRHGDAATDGIKQDSPSGEYGSHGIFRAEDFVESNGKKREVMGVHSGRKGMKDGAEREGVDHATNGCIRTTDEGMATIEETATTDPLETITVENNKAPVKSPSIPTGGPATPGQKAKKVTDGVDTSDPFTGK